MRPIAVIAFVLLGAGCLQREGMREGATLITSDPSCRSCQIILRPIAVLGDSLDSSSPRPDAAGRECMVGRLSTGEYVVSGLVGGGRLNVYSPTGTLVRTIGRQGQGPGEFGERVRVVVGRGDTVFTMDDSNLRVQVLMPNGEYVRSFPSQGRVRNFALLNSGDLLLQKVLTRPEDPVFHVVNASGAEIARFGRPTQAELDLELSIASPDRADGFWTASVWKYEMQHWGGPDSLRQTLVRNVDWFPAGGAFVAGTYRTVPPPPFLVHLWEDAYGRLWAYTLVPDPKWSPGRPMRPSPEWFRATFDTKIEVIDLKNARLIATGGYDSRLGMVCSSNLMYTVIETPDGDTRIQVIEPTLVGSPGS